MARYGIFVNQQSFSRSADTRPTHLSIYYNIPSHIGIGIFIYVCMTDAGCEVRGDKATQLFDDRIRPATDEDWDTEYLDSIISIKQVSTPQEAIDHVNTHGSQHTDAIVTDDREVAETFLNGVNSAIALHNASTQFADGGEFGMGAEIGIATGKLHARGPVGIEQLTTFKYVVRGTGQVRP